MRSAMDFGPLGDIEPALRAQGVALAPISTGDASLSSQGVTVLATATADDITAGRVKGLVVPGGSTDDAALASVRALVSLARNANVPVLAFGDAVALVGDVFEAPTDAPGAVFRQGDVAPLNERADLPAAIG